MSKGPPVHGLVYDPEKKRFDRFALSQVQFDNLAFTAQLVDTVIQLLASPEEGLVIKALHHLDQFAMRYIGHYDVMHKKQILPNIFRHLEDGHLFKMRFAWKLLSQMFIVPEAQAEILGDNKVFQAASKIFGEVAWFLFLPCTYNKPYLIYPD